MQNFKLTVAYDGTRYSGWQKQRNTGSTVQGKLEQALSALLGAETAVQGSGRTDAGVHAAGQVVSFQAETDRSCAELCRCLREAMPLDIGILSLEPAAPRFHARLSATGKTYRYRIWNSEVPNVFERRYLHIVPEPLDLAAMRQALPCFLGTHDFRAFCSNPNMKKSTVRTIRSITLEQLGSELRLTVTGDGFLYNMVRLIAGTLLRVGRGELCPADAAQILESGDRRLAGPMAPACGLCLMEVFYD